MSVSEYERLELIELRANTLQAELTALRVEHEKLKRSYQNLSIENRFMHSKILELERGES